MNELHLAMNGRWLGTLRRAPRGLELVYDPDWIAGPAVPLSLSLPLSTEPRRGPEVEAYFDNLLPDRLDVRAQLRTVLGAESTSVFDLLAVAGRDCVGAVQLLPNREVAFDVKPRLEAISDGGIASLLRTSASPLGHRSREDDFRISLAGAQYKTALTRWNEGWHRPLGTTPTTHILKPPIPDTILRDSVENEWLCAKVCAALGLQVAEASIARFEDVRALVVQRFDRRVARDGRILRLPQEDGCQASGVPSDRKYETDGGPGIATIMKHLQGASLHPLDDQLAFLKANVVFWLLAAPDGHAKNFSFMLRQRGRIQLAPLYDVLSVYPDIERRAIHLPKLKMAMAVSGKNRHYAWGEIHRRHWIATGKACGVSTERTSDMLDDVATLGQSVGSTISLPAGFPDAVAEPIFRGIEKAAARLA